MKICVYGLWHLGSVTAACLAGTGFETVGLDDNADVIAKLKDGKPPLYEPDLDELTRAGIASGKLTFTSDRSVIAGVDILWVTFDTPVDDDDRADTGFVIQRIRETFPFLHDGAIILVSSQLPVGTVIDLERDFAAASSGKHVSFAYVPENLRLGKAIHVFRHPERVIVGLRDEAAKPVIMKVLAPFSDHIIWIGTEAAELTKHAINAFLATCVTFINEIAMVCEKIGADAQEVERALRSEPRIGPNAYIRPGAAFSGGTLARDVTFLCEIARNYDLPLDLIGSILESNRFHGGWTMRKLKQTLGTIDGRRIALLGLAYKPGTDSTRRSLAVELGVQLSRAGAKVAAFDPVVKRLPSLHESFSVVGSLTEALFEADALVLMTEWPEFKSLKAEELLKCMATPIILDQNRFLSHLAADPRVTYLTIGRP